jgi:RND family efflux transporter MFP subunit
VRPTPVAAVPDLVLPGTVQAFYEAPIYARVSGYLRSWNFDIGAHVKRGDVLAVIDAPDIDQQFNHARAALASALADRQIAALTASRWQALLKTNSVAGQSADEKSALAKASAAAVQAAQADVARLTASQGFETIVAPFDGVVTARHTDIGDLIDAGSGHNAELFKVADIHAMRVYVAVPQAESASLPPGTEAALTMPQYPGESFNAVLRTTAGAVSESARTVLFELSAPNPDGRLLPGGFTQVHFHLPADPGRLEIPASAVIFQAEGTQVAVVDEAGQVTLKSVELGRDLGTSVEVLAGVGADDRIIDTPSDSLNAGDRVRVAASPRQGETASK